MSLSRNNQVGYITVLYGPTIVEVPGPVTKQLLAAHSEMVGVDIVDQALRYGG